MTALTTSTTVSSCCTARRARQHVLSFAFALALICARCAADRFPLLYCSVPRAFAFAVCARTCPPDTRAAPAVRPCRTAVHSGELAVIDAIGGSFLHFHLQLWGRLR
jgi:hypothetical protein